MMKFKSDNYKCNSCRHKHVYVDDMPCVNCIYNNNYEPQPEADRPMQIPAVIGCCPDKYSSIKRWNIELFDDGIYACTNEHDKGDKCDYKKLSNNELYEIIEYLRNGR